MQFVRVEDAVERIRMDFAEMPGLSLTFWQAQRLWNLSQHLCELALKDLTGSGYLVQTREGCYRRAHPKRFPSSLVAAFTSDKPWAQ